MKILVPGDKIVKEDNTIYLAGTTPLDHKNDWREKVIKMLKNAKFDGYIYNPDYSLLKNKLSYEDQIMWEVEAMKSSEVVAFWIERDMPKRPGLTTNVEFGYHLPRSNVVYGRPDESEKCFYLDHIYLLERNKKPANNLKDFVKEILQEVYLNN